MDTLLWILQAILSFKFVSAAFTHAFQSTKPTMQQSIQKMGSSARLVHSIFAFLMVVASISLVLPAFINSLAWLAPLSAAGLAGLNLISLPLHLKFREKPMLFAGVILLALSAFVAYGRWILSPL